MKLIFWVLRVLGFLFLISSCTSFTSTELTEYGFEKSKKIDEIFAYTADKVLTFQKQNNRRPYQKEFSDWNAELSEFGLYGRIMVYYPSNYPEESLKELGPPTKTGFVLGVWRGEWWEYYASWAQESTLPKSLSDYYATGSRLKDTVLFACVGLILVCFSFYPRFRKTRANSV